MLRDFIIIIVHAEYVYSHGGERKKRCFSKEKVGGKKIVAILVHILHLITLSLIGLKYSVTALITVCLLV